MNIDILHIHPAATTPTYATDGAGCFDLYAVEDCVIPPGAALAVDTGIALGIPAGWCVKIHSRSGLAFRHGITAFSGIVDSDYTGPVRVLLHNAGGNAYHVKAGDRIAQAKPESAPRVTFWRAEQLDMTERGAGGFGSSGA